MKGIIVGIIVVFNLKHLSSTFLKMNKERSEEVSAKMQKNAVKYPVEKARGSNRKYTDL